mmetsp:Transcript_23704/g.68149  ORF Transcript_23704/g.68149 Transcript_23704/m.68149 type:complete len:202 (+) Transcript_23704:327-932(+)
MEELAERIGLATALAHDVAVVNAPALCGAGEGRRIPTLDGPANGATWPPLQHLSIGPAILLAPPQDPVPFLQDEVVGPERRTVKRPPNHQHMLVRLDWRSLLHNRLGNAWRNGWHSAWGSTWRNALRNARRNAWRNAWRRRLLHGAAHSGRSGDAHGAEISSVRHRHEPTVVLPGSHELWIRSWLEHHTGLRRRHRLPAEI